MGTDQHCVSEEQLPAWPLLATEIGGPFITDWQISRLMPKPKDGVAGAECVGLDSPNAEWRTHQGELGAAFVCVQDPSTPSDGLVYLARRMDIESDGEWELALGHDGPASLFVDGKRVLTEPQLINPGRPARSCVTLELAEGRHEVVIAFDLAQGKGWGFYFQVCPAARRYSEIARRYGLSTGFRLDKPCVKPAIVQPYGESTVDVRMGEPVTLFVAPNNEGTRGWGVYGFPGMYRTTTGDIVVYSTGDADSYDIETATRADEVSFRSSDNGKTWQKVAADEVEPEQYYFIVSDGTELLFRSERSSLNLRELGVEPVGSVMMSNDGALLGLFRYGDIPAETRRFDVLTRKQGETEWKVESGTFNFPEWTLAGTIKVFRHPFWWVDVDPVIDIAKFFRDGRFRSALVEADDGTLLCPIDVVISKDGRWFEETHCMASADRGKTWEHRAVMAHQPELNTHGFTEEFSAVNVGGEIVCVIRMDHCTLDPDNATMATMQTRSKDNGFTWSYPQPVASSSVTPNLAKLDNGVVALIFGRPGVHVQFSTDGCYTWNTLTSIIGKTKEEELAAGRNLFDAMYNDTVSYSNTRVMITGPDRFLVLYTDFKHRGEDGELHKSIKVREIVVRPR